MTTRFKCQACGKLTAGRIPTEKWRTGDGSLRYPRRHNSELGSPCPGIYDEAEWVDV